MAIEINEMVVKASTGGNSSGQDPDREKREKESGQALPDMEQLKKVILTECREMILEILEEQMER
jgi:hypothetical protein